MVRLAVGSLTVGQLARVRILEQIRGMQAKLMNSNVIVSMAGYLAALDETGSAST